MSALRGRKVATVGDTKHVDVAAALADLGAERVPYAKAELLVVGAMAPHAKVAKAQVGGRPCITAADVVRGHEAPGWLEAYLAWQSGLPDRLGAMLAALAESSRVTARALQGPGGLKLCKTEKPAPPTKKHQAYWRFDGDGALEGEAWLAGLSPATIATEAHTVDVTGYEALGADEDDALPRARVVVSRPVAGDGASVFGTGWSSSHPHALSAELRRFWYAWPVTRQLLWLDADFATCLDAVIELRGIPGWPMLLVGWDKLPRPEGPIREAHQQALDSLEAHIGALADAFDDFDPRPWLERLGSQRSYSG